jgi:hypothetical protein
MGAHWNNSGSSTRISILTFNLGNHANEGVLGIPHLVTWRADTHVGLHESFRYCCAI